MKPKNAAEVLDTLWAEAAKKTGTKSIGQADPAAALALPFLDQPNKGLTAPLVSHELADMLREELGNPKP